MLARPDNERFEIRGVKLEVPTALLVPVIRRALSEGWYESDEAEQLPLLIQPGDVVLEIGGGIGLVSTLAARHLNVRHVYTVEANPELIPIIHKTHRANKVSVGVFNEVLGPDNGKHTFTISPHFWASSAEGFYKGRTVEVPKRSFEERLAELQPSLLIVDIEGGEATIFEHASLAGVRQILLEVHQGVIGGRGIRKTFDTLSAKGFHYDQRYSRGHVVVFTRVDN